MYKLSYLQAFLCVKKNQMPYRHDLLLLCIINILIDFVNSTCQMGHTIIRTNQQDVFVNLAIVDSHILQYAVCQIGPKIVWMRSSQHDVFVHW